MASAVICALWASTPPASPPRRSLRATTRACYLKASDPERPRGVWIRYTVLKRPGVSLRPLATFSDRVRFGEQTVEIDGWPGMVGHNWGTEHAERWIWVHAAGFPDAPGVWFDVTIGRIRVGRAVLPWIANGALQLERRLYRLGGPAAIRTTAVRETPTRCAFALRGRGVAVRGEVGAREDLAVAWRYSDPGGGEHKTTNCSVASLALTVRPEAGEERILRIGAGAAYELGAREDPPGIPLQPFPDP
jgi:hypothetical protein